MGRMRPMRLMGQMRRLELTVMKFFEAKAANGRGFSPFAVAVWKWRGFWGAVDWKRANGRRFLGVLEAGGLRMGQGVTQRPMSSQRAQGL
jgi:hypothetical protein